MLKRFYVYRIFNVVGTLYVGKGSGTRLKSQMRRFGADGEILAHYADEDAAYKAERRFIKALRPLENRHPGGNGSRYGKGAYRPNGFTPEGLEVAAESLARLAKFVHLPGVARILCAYVDAHGMETVASKMRPFLVKDLPVQINP